MQELCRTYRCRDFFIHDLIQEEPFFTVKTLRILFVRDHQHSSTFRAGSWDGALPGSEITLWVISTSVKIAAFAGLSFDNFPLVLGAEYTDLLQPGLRVPAVREIIAADELPVSTPADYQVPSVERARSAYLFQLFHLWNILLCQLDLSCEGTVKFSDYLHPRQITCRDLIQVFLHRGSKPDIQNLWKILDQQVVDQEPGFGGNQAFAFTADITPLLQGSQDGRISGRSANAVLFQSPHQGSLREARRRLGKMLFWK